MLRSLTWGRIWSVFRILIALLTATAVSRQLGHSLSLAVGADRDTPMTVANFFSYFTILSNVLTLVVMLWAAIWFFARGANRTHEPRVLSRLLAATTTYMVITGLVYNTLLRGIELAPGTSIPWTNEVLHVVGPVFLLLDLFLGPLRRRLPWRSIWSILAFPIVWVVYTLLRGEVVTDPVTGNPWWYPYPFLNPHTFDNGYGTVLLYVVGIAIAITGAGLCVVGVGRRPR